MHKYSYSAGTYWNFVVMFEIPKSWAARTMTPRRGGGIVIIKLLKNDNLKKQEDVFCTLFNVQS